MRSTHNVAALWILLLVFGTAAAAEPAAESRESAVRDVLGGHSEESWWRVSRLPHNLRLSPPAGSLDRAPSNRGRDLLRDVPFLPTERPAPGGVAVEQVIVAGDALAADFQPLADRATGRGIPTVLRTVSWIDSTYTGADRPARIRAFLREAHDLWGTEAAVLGGDVEHVPTRYIPWQDIELPTDYYYECLDGEWNEDGDAIFAEPLPATNLAGFVNDVAVAPDGRIWAGTNVGVTVLDNGSFTHYDMTDGLPSDAVDAVDVAPGGSVWLATTGGVARWDGFAWASWDSAGSALPSDEVLCIRAVSDTDVWAGTNLGLGHWDGAGWTVYTVADGLPSDAVTALSGDAATLWIGTLSGAVTRSGGAFSAPVNTGNSGLLSDLILSIDVDPAGDVWFGHLNVLSVLGGVSRWDGATWTTYDLAAWGGPTVRGVTAGSGPGELWGATSAGLYHLAPGTEEMFTDLDGLPGIDVNAVALQANGDLAVAGAEGLSVGPAAAWTVYTEENGLPTPPVTYDDIDLVSDLVVGRIPATDSAEAATYLQKLADYEDGLVVDHVESALLLGEILFAGSDGKDICLQAAAELPANFSTTELYEVDGTQDAALSLAAMTAGHGINVHVGHGSYDALGVGPDSPLQLLFNTDVGRFDSGNRYGLFIGYNCNSGGFDMDCTMEQLLFNPTGGAVVTTSNARSSIAAIDAEMNSIFLEKLFASADGNPARAFQSARAQIFQDLTDSVMLETWWRRQYLSRSLLGSPTLSLWRSAPQAMTVTHPASVAPVRAPYTVTVTGTVSGLPVADALVCVNKNGEDYAYGRTDAAGQVTFDFRPETAGSLDVTATAPDFLPYYGSTAVTAGSGPHPVAEAWQRVVPGASRAGSLDLQFSLWNAGTASGAGWSLALTSADPRVTVLQGVGTLAAVGAGASAWTSTFSVNVDPAVADAEQFPLTLTGSGASDFTETFLVSAEAPALHLDAVQISGADIFPTLTNGGAQLTGLVTASLTALDTTATVVDGFGSLAPLGPAQTATFTDGFTVTGSAAAKFQLQIDDGFGVVVTWIIDREAPAGATAASAEPRDSGALVTWTQSPSDDVAGYRIFGKQGGAWGELFTAPVVGGSRAVVPLADGGAQDLLILAVDEGGLVSPDSCFVTAYAAVPTLAGWPQRVWSQIGPSPLVATDLDGDGTREIMHGAIWEANAAHVFRADGTEWTDGDADPATRGVFGVTGERVVSAPFAMDVDGDNLKEVFATSYDGMLYGWRTDGPAGQVPTPLPGFPVNVTGSSLRSSPVAADVDGDGDREIVVVASYQTVHAYETDGSVVPGWPFTTTSGGLHTTPAVADLNGDGRDDLVFTGNTDNVLYAVSGDGTSLPGWPADLGVAAKSSAVLADIDGDADPEIFVIATDGSVHAFHHDDRDAVPGADPVAGWPVMLNAPVAHSTPSPALADFDADGVPEIVINGDGEIAVLRADGTAMPGTPIVTGAAGQSSPVVADLDGDGQFEIVATTADRLVHAYRLDGTDLPGWPRRFAEQPKSSPYIADVDGDGDLDVVLGSDDGLVRVVDTPGADLPGAVPWAGYHGGPDRQGVYLHIPYTTTDSPGYGPLLPALPASVLLESAAPNPFRTATDLRFALPKAGPVTLDVLDVRGRRVVRLLEGRILPAGAHSALWDGRDRAGRPVAAGMYFLRLQAGSDARTGKVLRLR